MGCEGSSWLTLKSPKNTKLLNLPTFMQSKYENKLSKKELVDNKKDRYFLNLSKSMERVRISRQGAGGNVTEAKNIDDTSS